jgi:hypothetical protein
MAARILQRVPLAVAAVAGIRLGDDGMVVKPGTIQSNSVCCGEFGGGSQVIPGYYSLD